MTIPTDSRRPLDVNAGDELRWAVDEDGRPIVDVVRQRHGAVDDFAAVDGLTRLETETAE